MNKKIKLTSICIIFLLCVIGYIYNTNNNISLQDNNVTYAISLDGEKTSSFPAIFAFRLSMARILNWKWGFIWDWRYFTWDLAATISFS